VTCDGRGMKLAGVQLEGAFGGIGNVHQQWPHERFRQGF
jgi:hypothetical protein